MNFFDKLNDFIRSSESSIVNFLSAIAPWGAPLIPAWGSYSHAINNLGYPQGIALAIAVVVEVLGLSSISTILAFWSHNKRYKKDFRKAPIGLAILSFGAYLGVIITVNVILDAVKLYDGYNSEIIGVLAKAFLNLLSVPAAIILAIRTQHKELIDGLEEEREERRMQRQAPIVRTTRVVSESGTRGKAKRYISDLRAGRLEEKLKTAGLENDAEGISKLYDVSLRTAYRWMNRGKSI